MPSNLFDPLPDPDTQLTDDEIVEAVDWGLRLVRDRVVYSEDLRDALVERTKGMRAERNPRYVKYQEAQPRRGPLTYVQAAVTTTSIQSLDEIPYRGAYLGIWASSMQHYLEASRDRYPISIRSAFDPAVSIAAGIFGFTSKKRLSDSNVAKMGTVTDSTTFAGTVGELVALKRPDVAGFIDPADLACDEDGNVWIDLHASIGERNSSHPELKVHARRRTIPQAHALLRLSTGSSDPETLAIPTVRGIDQTRYGLVDTVVGTRDER